MAPLLIRAVVLLHISKPRRVWLASLGYPLLGTNDSFLVGSVRWQVYGKVLLSGFCRLECGLLVLLGVV